MDALEAFRRPACVDAPIEPMEAFPAVYVRRDLAEGSAYLFSGSFFKQESIMSLNCLEKGFA